MRRRPESKAARARAYLEQRPDASLDDLVRGVPGILVGYASNVRATFGRERANARNYADATAQNSAADYYAHVPAAEELIRLCGGVEQARETLEMVAAVAKVWEVIENMDREQALKLLRGGRDSVKEWNEWTKRGEKKLPDLSHAELHGADLYDAKLSRANLRGADLSETDLSYADLCHADLSGHRKCSHLAIRLPTSQCRSARHVFGRIAYESAFSPIDISTVVAE